MEISNKKNGNIFENIPYSIYFRMNIYIYIYIYICTPVRLGSSFLKCPSSAPSAAPEWSLDHGAKSALLALPQDMQQVPGEFPPWSGLEGKLASREFNSLLLKMAHL